MRGRGWLPFVLALIPLLFGVLFFSWLRLTFFAPFLIIVIYHSALPKALWKALLCGLVIDLLASDARFGLHALNYTLTLGLIYGLRQRFFADSLTTLPILTAIFSIASTLIQVGLLGIFETRIPLSWSWMLTDLVMLSLADSLYAFVWFTLPYLLVELRQGRPAASGFALKRPQ